MTRRIAIIAGTPLYGIFSALVGPRIMLAPDDGAGAGGGDGGAGNVAGAGASGGVGGTDGAGGGDAGGGAGGGADGSTAAGGEEKPAKSALAGALDQAKPGDGAAAGEGEKEKPAEGDAAAEEKAGEGEPAADSVVKDIDGNPLPETYEIKMPDGVTLDAEALALAVPAFKEHKLSPAQAQAVADVYTKIQADAIAKHQEQTANWLKESKADKEIGGRDYEKNLAHAHRAFQAFGSERAMQIFDTYGLGNNPEILRIFTRMGKALGEGTTILPGDGGGRPSTAEVLYPQHAK